MPKIHVRKSIVIQAPLEKVYDSVRDFRQWPIWSPWLVTEPECTVTYADDGKQYAWDGKVVGSGEMSIASEDKPKSIHYLLHFLKPWKSKAEVTFQFEEKDGGVEVAWVMDSALPLFLFFMRPMMTALIGMDYERGLRMLKDYLETGSVPSKLEFLGQTAVAAANYVGIKTETSIDEMGPAMERDLEKLRQWLGSANVRVSGKPFSIYHKWDPTKARADYTIAFPLETVPDELPDGFIQGNLPACQAFPVKHTGDYKHLGNAWSAGIFRARNKVFAQSKKIPPFEVYETAPGEVADDAHVAIVHFPVK